MRLRPTRLALVLATASFFTVPPAASASVPRTIVFPVIGKVAYTDDFGDPRPQGEHQANDIMGHRHQLVVAAEPGKVRKWSQSGPTGLCMLYLYGRSGTTYLYIHLNNDLTNRNDNDGGCHNRVAYAPHLKSGQHVRKGQLIGYVGDSGDANGMQPHLHFELHPNGGAAVSPYKWLQRGRRLLYAVPMTVDSVALTMTGIVRWTSPRLNLGVRRVRTSQRLTHLVRKPVGVGTPIDVQVYRRTASGDRRTVTLGNVDPGDNVRVWTERAAPTFATQVGAAGAWTARRITILSDG